MKLPIIRSTAEYSNDNPGELDNAIRVIEHVSQARGWKDNELEVIGEVLSNLYGAKEVSALVAQGQPQKEALNDFMKRVMGSIDRQVN